MTNYQALARDALAAREGDQLALARLARRGVPLLLKRVLPGVAAPLVDMAAAGYDALARPEARAEPDDPAAPYASPGFKRFIRWLALEYRHGVIVLIGGGGQGKTATMCAIAERLKTTASHLFIVGVGASALRNTPLEVFDWPLGRRGETPRQRAAREMLIADQLETLPEESVVLIPDAGLYLDARHHGGDAEEAVRDLVQIARHRRLRFLLDVQYSSLLSKSSMLVKALLYKPLGVTGDVIEREELRKLSRISQAAFDALPADQRRKHIFVYCDEANFRGLVPVRLPSWYSKAISESHAEPMTARPSVIEGDYTVIGQEDADPPDEVA